MGQPKQPVVGALQKVAGARYRAKYERIYTKNKLFAVVVCIKTDVIRCCLTRPGCHDSNGGILGDVLNVFELIGGIGVFRKNSLESGEDLKHINTLTHTNPTQAR